MKEDNETGSFQDSGCTRVRYIATSAGVLKVNFIRVA